MSGRHLVQCRISVTQNERQAMGVLYTAWPVDQQMTEWLDELDIEAPKAASRFPSKVETRNALGALRDLRIKYTDNGPGARWSAFIDCADDDTLWTVLHAEPKDGNDDVTEIHFEKGEPALILALLRDLSSVTGPIVLIADTGDAPVVVHRSIPFAESVRHLSDLEDEPSNWQRLIGCAPGAL